MSSVNLYPLSECNAVLMKWNQYPVMQDIHTAFGALTLYLDQCDTRMDIILDLSEEPEVAPDMLALAVEDAPIDHPNIGVWMIASPKPAVHVIGSLWNAISSRHAAVWFANSSVAFTSLRDTYNSTPTANGVLA